MLSLSKPVLARCDNRSRHARKHPSSGDPEDWLADTYLKPYGLLGLTFDFFVNWDEGSVPNELWIKRIVNDDYTPWPMEHAGAVPNAIYQCDREEKVQQLCRFADRHDFTCHYLLFKESSYFGVRPEPIVEVGYDGNGDVVHIRNVKLPNLIDRIQQLRGGPFYTSKRLIYGRTSLDCYLYNNTAAMLPGDADLVLVDSSFTPRVIIEFKKDTIGTPISSETLSKYYRSDPKKYDSFAYFRDHLTNDRSTLPTIVLYYSVKPNAHQVKLERIEGAAGRLRATNSELVPLPNANDETSCKKLIEALLGMI